MRSVYLVGTRKGFWSQYQLFNVLENTSIISQPVQSFTAPVMMRVYGCSIAEVATEDGVLPARSSVGLLPNNSRRTWLTSSCFQYWSGQKRMNRFRFREGMDNRSVG